MKPPRPGPELRPVKYWPAERSDDPDLGLFTTRRDQIRGVAAAQGMIATFLAVLAGISDNGARPFLLAAVLFGFGLSATFFVVSRRLDVPPSGVWRVDAEGYPVAHVAAKPAAGLRKARGVTRDALMESIALRSAGQS